MIKLIKGDCLEKMKEIESGSVDLILTDPPYGTVKGAKFYDYAEGVQWDNVLPYDLMWEQINRVLRKNGKCILFSQEPFTSNLIKSAIPNVPFSYRNIWLKDNFANALLVNKAPVNYYEDICVFSKTHETEAIHPLRPYFKNIMDYIGLNLKQINTKLGHRRAEHTFYVTAKQAIIKEVGQKGDHVTRIGSSQFSLCTEKTYKELIEVFGIDKMQGFKNFAELKVTDERFKKEFASTFNIWQGKKYKSNVFEYKKDYDGYHPTQKPVALLEDLIKTYSNENNTVLDFTFGSCSTGIACINTNRKFIGIELDDKYFDIAKKRIEECSNL